MASKLAKATTISLHSVVNKNTAKIKSLHCKITATIRSNKRPDKSARKWYLGGEVTNKKYKDKRKGFKELAHPYSSHLKITWVGLTQNKTKLQFKDSRNNALY